MSLDMNSEPTVSEKADILVRTIDELIKARTRQQVAIFVENAEGAAYHAETATDALNLLRNELELLLS